MSGAVGQQAPSHHILEALRLKSSHPAVSQSIRANSHQTSHISRSRLLRLGPLLEGVERAGHGKNLTTVDHSDIRVLVNAGLNPSGAASVYLTGVRSRGRDRVQESNEDSPSRDSTVALPSPPPLQTPK